MNKAFLLQKPMNLKMGVNHVAVLSSTLGMMVSIELFNYRYLHASFRMLFFVQLGLRQETWET